MGTAIYCAAIVASRALERDTKNPIALFIALIVMLVFVVAFDVALLEAIRNLRPV
jgi:hypothetical protein